ncbi:hypothetical protein EUX98_g2475 [Antrodiella citrinella]|uniref:Uncharacterized protein n=1 Tax=Antrodiella citrinella TaxID=2447956 RepID=A0A4V3XJ51_9APHY|nr:hypothetical protein EUX98_g2475 [Antrodiella citrinella]
MSSKVAFWLPFGDVETVPEDALKLPKALIPSPSHIHALRYPPPAYEPPPLPSGPAPSEEDLEITRRLRLEALEKYPEPHPMSYQNRGEFCQDFMKRRAAAHAKFLKVESAREKDTREKQKLMYDGPSGQRMPSTDSSVKIFYWEPVEGVEGYRSRTCIDKSQWEDYWRNRNGQRLYDEFYNEFDISSEFGDDADRWDDVDAEGASVHDSASEADDDADVLDMGSSTPEPGEVVEELGANTSMSDSAKALSVLMNIANVTESNAREAPVPDSVEDVLSYLHSLHTDSFPDEAGKALLAPSLAMTILGLTRARPDPALYPLLQRYTTNPERKPTALDVERVRRSGARLKIIAKAYSEHVWDVFGVCQGPCYIIESDEPGDVEWFLTVDEATIVLLIIRHGWGPHIRDIATELLKRGIVFHTYRTRPLHALDEELRHHTYISWRNVSLGYHCGSEGLAVDFCSYVNVRNRFLRETHACRAALLHGGITWRIAMDALGYEYASGQVLAGPGRDCVEFGAMPQFLSDGTELWDDVLSPQELDLICGVYKADPGMYPTS